MVDHVEFVHSYILLIEYYLYDGIGVAESPISLNRLTLLLTNLQKCRKVHIFHKMNDNDMRGLYF